MPRIPAAIAVVLTVATCIGFNTARFPVVLQMAASRPAGPQEQPVDPDTSAGPRTTDVSPAYGSRPASGDYASSGSIWRHEQTSPQPPSTPPGDPAGNWGEDAQPAEAWASSASRTIQDQNQVGAAAQTQGDDSAGYDPYSAETDGPGELSRSMGDVGNSYHAPSSWSDEAPEAAHDAGQEPVPALPQSKYGASADPANSPGNATEDTHRGRNDERIRWNADARLVPVTEAGGWLSASGQGENAAGQPRPGQTPGWDTSAGGVGGTGSRVRRLPPVGESTSAPRSAALRPMPSGAIPLYPTTRQP